MNSGVSLLHNAVEYLEYFADFAVFAIRSRVDAGHHCCSYTFDSTGWKCVLTLIYICHNYVLYACAIMSCVGNGHRTPGGIYTKLLCYLGRFGDHRFQMNRRHGVYCNDLFVRFTVVLWVRVDNKNKTRCQGPGGRNSFFRWKQRTAKCRQVST